MRKFINKSITIAAEDKGINDIIIAAGVAVLYVSNTSTIDQNYILRSVTIIGRELHFPLNIYLKDLPLVAYNNTQAITFFSVSPILIVSLPLKY